MSLVCTKILVQVGDTVKVGDPVFTIEAMKMESTVTATQAGRVGQIYLKEKSLLNQDDLVLDIVSV